MGGLCVAWMYGMWMWWMSTSCGHSFIQCQRLVVTSNRGVPVVRQLRSRGLEKEGTKDWCRVGFFGGRTRRRVDIWIAAAHLRARKDACVRSELIQPLEKKLWKHKRCFCHSRSRSRVRHLMGGTGRAAYEDAWYLGRC